MPREISVIARRAAAWRLCGFLLLAAFTIAQNAATAGQLTMSIDIAQARWKTVHLRNMPKETSVTIQVESTGSIRIAFVHADEIKRFPAAATPEFQGRVERKLSFGVSIPRDGDYYLILDNRQGEQPRKIRLLIRAEKPKTPGNAPARPDAAKSRETRI